MMCRVKLPDGRVCGYVPVGDTSKARITDLYRHQELHVEAMNAKD
jgi:hypothetical protein